MKDAVKSHDHYILKSKYLIKERLRELSVH